MSRHFTLRILSLGLAASLALAACGAADGEPTATPSATLPSPPTETPSPTPFPLAGPEIGASMTWADGAMLVYVPAGEFIMGLDGVDNPQHTINLSAFWIYRSEVTNRMYALCVASGVCIPPIDPEAAADLYATIHRDKPVSGVTWEQADAYCKWAFAALPTEAQWEKAARGPGGSLYPWGDAAPNCNLANLGGCRGAITAAGNYPTARSYYQALDMLGNVSEWVRDWYDPSYYATSPAADPPGPASGTARVARGGSYLSDPASINLAQRSFLPPGEYGPDQGFRCVVESPQVFPAYCQTSAYVAGVPGSSRPDVEACIPPAVELKGTYCQPGGVGFATFDVDRAIEPVVSEQLDCQIVDDGRVLCSGQPEITVEVEVCSLGCAQVASSELPAGLTCPPGFAVSPLSPYLCEYVPGSAPLIECPPGVSCAPTLDQSANCPPGLYFDRAVNACVPSGPASSQCAAGYAYNPQAQCCQLQASGQYPGCGPGEYDDTLLGCLPLPGLASTGCAAFPLTMPNCPQEPVVCAEIRNQVKCDHTPGCKWFVTSQEPRAGECRVYPEP